MLCRASNQLPISINLSMRSKKSFEVIKKENLRIAQKIIMSKGVLSFNRFTKEFHEHKKHVKIMEKYRQR